MVNSWPGGFQADVTVANTGTRPTSGWTVTFTLPSGETVRSVWNATASPSSGAVTATAVAYNASVPAGGSTTWGVVVDGGSPPLPAMTCTAR